jgi:hypothetical protein
MQPYTPFGWRAVVTRGLCGYPLAFVFVANVPRQLRSHRRSPAFESRAAHLVKSPGAGGTGNGPKVSRQEPTNRSGAFDNLDNLSYR